MNQIIEKVNDKHLGTYYALRNADAKVAFKNPMQSCKKIELSKTDVVVDIGAYIGEYSMWASKFAKKVVSYEASPQTFKILSKNQRPNMTIFNKAVVGDNSKSIDLYLSNGVGATNSIVKKSRKSGKVTVPAINYDLAVKGATVVKIDVEGAEYGYDIIKPNLRAIILEFHPIEGINWKQKANGIMASLIQAGFISVMKPTFKNGWDTNSAWIRR